MEAHTLQRLFAVLPRTESGTTAAAILQHAIDHGRVSFVDGVLDVRIPIGHPHWPIVNSVDVKSEIDAAGHGMGIETVQLVPTRGAYVA